MENFLNIEKLNLEASYDKTEIEKIREEEPEYYNHIIDVFDQQYQEISDAFPQNFRVSFLTQIISFVEFNLKEICDFVAFESKQTFHMADLKGNSDFEKAGTYLKRVTQFELSSLGENWKFIEDCRVIRNKLIHQQGNVGDKETIKKRVEEFLPLFPGISLEERLKGERWEIRINSKELNSKLLIFVADFFTHLLASI